MDLNVKRSDLESYALQAVIRFPELKDETSIQRENFNDVVNRECFTAICAIDKDYRANDGSIPISEIAIRIGLAIDVLANRFRTAFSDNNREQAKAWVERLVEIFAGERFEAEMKESFKLQGSDRISSGIAVVEKFKQLGVGQGIKTYKDIVSDYCDSFARLRDGRPGISTGLPALDNLVRGWCPGELTTMVAAAGVGKSTLAAQLLFAVARREDAPSILFSGEMTAGQLGERYVHSECRVPLGGVLTAADVSSVRNSLDMDTTLTKIIVDNKPVVTALQIRTVINKVLSEYGAVSVVMCDHLRHVYAGGTSDYEKASRAIEALKIIALEIPVSLCVLTHLNRTRTETSEPQLEQIRASGWIEEYSDSVVLLWRGDGPLTSCRVAKSRQGRTGKIMLSYDPMVQQYSS